MGPTSRFRPDRISRAVHRAEGLPQAKEANVTHRIQLSAMALFCAAALAPVTLSQTGADEAPATSVSKIRIVRLSEVRGAVQLDRSTGKGFEAAMANLPIVEKNRLRTDQGVAEVEFEDNSTLRLAPDSVLEFPRLERRADGPTLSTVHLVRGTAYVSLVKSKGNEFHLSFDKENVVLPAGSHVRLQTDDATASLAVFDGTAHVDGPQGATDVARRQTVLFHLVEQGEPTVERKVTAETYDEWDKESSGYHARTAAMSAMSGSPYSYGLNDLAYYGNFFNAGSCGMLWQPYFVSAGWDPYSNGAWAYYPSAGYSWVSPYPWAWTPYHSGSWSFCPGTGWGWQPGGAWNGLNNVAVSGANTPLRFHPPANPPAPGQATLTFVGTRPLVRSEMQSADSFVFRQDSAGLGIPRETLGRLDKLSRETAAHGMTTTRVYVSAPVSERQGFAQAGPASIHRGYAAASSNVGAQVSRGGNSGGPVGNANSAAPMASAPSAGHVSTSSGHPH